MGFTAKASGFKIMVDYRKSPMGLRPPVLVFGEIGCGDSSLL